MKFSLIDGISSTSVGETKKAEQPRSTSVIYRRFGKRTFDILFALALLPLMSALIFLFWAVAKLEGGSGFFCQQRVGQNGRRFTCWKLKTMVDDADKALQDLCASNPAIAREWAANQKLKNDPRITRTGKFLRATSLDELPQIFNVLRGDMSFVGPRPFMVEQEEMYLEAGGIDYFDLRPGITGPWQVEGRGTTSFLDRIHFDNCYNRDLSLVGDALYIIRTVTVVFKRSGH